MIHTTTITVKQSTNLVGLRKKLDTIAYLRVKIESVKGNTELSIITYSKCELSLIEIGIIIGDFIPYEDLIL